MNARTTIIAGSFFWFLIPISYLEIRGCGLSFAVFVPLLLPFVGTCPFPFDPYFKNLTDSLYDWPVLMLLMTAGIALYGFLTKSRMVAAVFWGVMFICWVMTALRVFVFDG
jgi:hypothetical protein